MEKKAHKVSITRYRGNIMRDEDTPWKRASDMLVEIISTGGELPLSSVSPRTVNVSASHR